MMGENKKFRIARDSKVFMSMFRSALYILLVPVIVSIMLTVSFIRSMEKEAENFRELMLDKITDEVNHEFWDAYQVINTIRNTDLITSYAKTEKRDYWTEYQIYKFMNKVLTGFNLGEAYLYFPQYELVISTTKGTESQYFYASSYEEDYEEWKDALKSSWNGRIVQLTGKDLQSRNLIVSNILNSKGDEPAAVIALQLKNEYINQRITELQLDEGNRILVFNVNGVIGSNYGATNEDALTKLLEKAVENGKERIHFGSIVYELQIRHSSQYDLTFVYASPKDVFHSSFASARIYSFLAVTMCILLSLVLCLALTHRNYMPVKRIFGLFRGAESEEKEREIPDDYDKMELYINEYIYKNRNLLNTVKRYENDYKEVYLEKILYGRIRYLEGIPESSRMYDLGLDDPHFVVIFYELVENEQDDFLETSYGDSDMLKDSLSAYIEEKMDYVTRFYLIEEQSGCICVLNGAGDPVKFKDRVEQDNAHILEEMNIQEKICCTGYVSDVLSGLSCLHEGYEQVMRRREEEADKAEQQEITDQEGALQIDEVIRTVREQAADPDLSVAGIAENFHVTPSHLSRFFKQQMGVGLLDYIHCYRIDLAKELICNEPSIRIKEVADRTGFYNVASFIRVFKKLENITPGQYREKYEENKR